MALFFLFQVFRDGLFVEENDNRRYVILDSRVSVRIVWAVGSRLEDSVCGNFSLHRFIVNLGYPGDLVVR
jgi:hypothetical protein